MSHEFQTLEARPVFTRGCLTMQLVVVGICVLVGAGLNEVVHQTRPGLVRANLVHNASETGPSMPSYGASFFADGPGDNILISYVGRRPERNALLTTVQTAETFELSFDLTPHDSAPADAWRSIVHVGQSNGQVLPAFYLYPRSTRLEVCMGRQDGNICSSPEETLPVGEVTHVGVRLVGDTFTVSLNGQQKCITGGFYQKQDTCPTQCRCLVQRLVEPCGRCHGRQPGLHIAVLVWPRGLSRPVFFSSGCHVCGATCYRFDRVSQLSNARHRTHDHSHDAIPLA